VNCDAILVVWLYRDSRSEKKAQVLSHGRHTARFSNKHVQRSRLIADYMEFIHKFIEALSGKRKHLKFSGHECIHECQVVDLEHGG
jgi:hypothetical protein